MRGVMESGAERAYARMARHFDGCRWCERAGAEMADPRVLCPQGRLVLERWLELEFGARTAAASPVRRVAATHAC